MKNTSELRTRWVGMSVPLRIGDGGTDGVLGSNISLRYIVSRIKKVLVLHMAGLSTYKRYGG